MLKRVSILAFGVLLISTICFAQSSTHTVLTNDQDFTVANSRYLSGVYECADGGYIDFSCLTGHLPEVNCPDGYAIQTIGPALSPVGCVAVSGGGGTPAGADTYVQYNNMGVFGADQNFTWDYTNSILTLGGGGPGLATFSGDTLASLGTPSNGTIGYCSDCTAATSPCSGSGNGSMAQYIDGAWDCFGGSGQGYDTVQEEGSSLTQRSILNFTGSGVTCADDAGNTRTNCAIPASTTYLWIAAAACQDPTAGSLFDLPSSNPAVPACQVGTNTIQGAMGFADGASTTSMQTTIVLAPNWDSSGTTSAQIWWNTTATSGDVVWQMQTSCVAAAESNDPSWNSANTVTDTAQGTGSDMNTASLNLTMTGCAAGETLHLNVFRDPTNGSDTLAATGNIFGLLLTLPKT